MNKPLPSLARTLAILELTPENEQALLSIASTANNTRDLITQVYSSQIISSQEMCSEFSSRFGAPLLDISAISLDSLPMDLIDTKLVEKNLALPIYKHGKKLFVAVIDPTNKAALDQIKFYSGLEIIPIQTELSLLDALLEKINNAESSSLDDFMDDGDLDLELPSDDDPAQENDDVDDANAAPIVISTAPGTLLRRPCSLPTGLPPLNP